MPFSQIFPPSPSPTESIRLFYTSVSLLLSRTQGYCYHLSTASYISCIGRLILYHKHHLGSPYKVPGEPLKYACTQAQAQVGVSWLEAPASYLKASQ